MMSHKAIHDSIIPDIEGKQGRAISKIVNGMSVLLPNKICNTTSGEAILTPLGQYIYECAKANRW